MSERDHPLRPPYDVSVRLRGNVLHASLSNDISKQNSVTWTLHRGDFDPSRASVPVIAGSEWQVQVPDISNGFAVRAVTGGITHQSRWIQVFSKDATRKYDDWRARWRTSPKNHLTEIPLFRYEAPFDSIAFVCHTSELRQDGLLKFATTNGLRTESQALHFAHLTVISGNGSALDASGVRYVFSGTTRDSERLLFGQDDIRTYTPQVRQLHDEIGEFHLLTWSNDQITFGHDYIGQGHLFYFERDGIFAAANGLHLLALTLRSLGVDLSLDVSAAEGVFFSTSYPFETRHGTRTDFKDIRRVSVYEKIEINEDGPRLAKTQMWRDNLSDEFSEETYEILLNQAKNDIIDNVRIALAHPRFDNVVVELSAGLDSRIVYSALTNLPPSDRVRISTRRGSEQTTAAAINNLYGFEWDDLPKRVRFDGAEDSAELPSTSHSVFMDGYFIETMFKPRQNYAHPTLLLTGHGGEAFSRVMSVEGYFARNFSGELPPPAESIEDILSGVIRYIGNHQIWLEAGDKHFGNTLCECLGESSSPDLMKQFADLYVSQRNPFVGGSVFRGAMSAPQWRPLHSKALFRLRALWFQRQQDFRLQFDLIRALNPLISEVPYLKGVENARKDEFSHFRTPFQLKAPIEFDYDDSKITTARSKSASRSTWAPSRTVFNAVASSVKEYEDSVESFLEPLTLILQLAPELDGIGLPLFTYIHRVANRTDPKAFSKRHNVRNKLHILAQEVLLIAGSRQSW